MMISHFINQILFSFLEQRAIPLPLLPSTLGGGLHFHPTWDRSLQRGGGIGVQLPREWAHNPTPPDRIPHGTLLPQRRSPWCNVSGRTPSCLGMGK